jgi:hypothetical protein|tara:strand:- start:41783 stop:42184 length:402 start_codon:yes stop_codon:yes gene_type:complete
MMFLASNVEARNTEVLVSANEAAENGIGKENLLDIPFYMKGQKHPRVKDKLGNYMSTRKTRGAFRSDTESCKIAFLSAIISLQKRVKKQGGDGIINIISVTKDQEYESTTKFRCIAGAIIVHVALRGDVVKFY